MLDILSDALAEAGPASASQTSADAADTAELWRKSYEAYLGARRLYEETSGDDPEIDERVDGYCSLMDVLIVSVPAPDLAALSIKLELIAERQDGFCFSHAYSNAVQMDLRRLSAGGSHAGQVSMVAPGNAQRQAGDGYEHTAPQHSAGLPA